MAYRKKRKILIGSQMKETYCGQYGKAKGMYTGGFTWYLYGIKGLIGYSFYEAWGDFIHDNPNLK